MAETDIENTGRDDRNLLEKNDGNYFLATFALIDRWPIPLIAKRAIKIFIMACVLATLAIMLSWPFWWHKMN